MDTEKDKKCSRSPHLAGLPLMPDGGRTADNLALFPLAPMGQMGQYKEGDEAWLN